jgi:hypothetical protein
MSLFELSTLILYSPMRSQDFKGKDEGVPANSANCGKWFYGLVRKLKLNPLIPSLLMLSFIYRS